MCAAFLHRPRAVVVDEPMVGLDPRGARLIKDVFRRMSERGVGDPDEHAHARSRAGDVRSDQHHPEGADHRARHGRRASARWASSDDDQLTSVFLKLTGGSGLQEIDEIV